MARSAIKEKQLISTYGGEEYVNITTFFAVLPINNALGAVSIGDGAFIGPSANNSISVMGGAIGQEAISIGEGSAAIGNNSVAIGQDSSAEENAVGIGNNTGADAADAIAIGNDSLVEDDCQKGVALGYNSAVQNASVSGISIGYGAQTTGGVNAIAIGTSSRVLDDNTIAIGYNAEVAASNINSVQIGTGTNTTVDSVQYRDTTIANIDGIQAVTGAGAPLSTPPDGTLYVDTTNDFLYVRIGGAWLRTATLVP